MIIKNVIHTGMLIFLITSTLLAQVKIGAFKASQLKNARVKDAYDTKWGPLQEELKKIKVNADEFDIYMRAFKREAELEVWLKNKGDAEYKLFKTYAICANSGSLGPKRKEGDGQVPEGFYQIDLLNPKSDYYLSMRINYPNASDMLLKEGPTAGGAIMVHGDCVTIGCLPMTDDKIKELYVLCLEAKNRSNPVYIDIFPTRLTNENIQWLKDNYPKTKLAFWNSLRPAYDYFEEHHWLPKVNIDKKGKYFYQE